MLRELAPEFMSAVARQPAQLRSPAKSPAAGVGQWQPPSTSPAPPVQDRQQQPGQGQQPTASPRPVTVPENAEIIDLTD